MRELCLLLNVVQAQTGGNLERSSQVAYWGPLFSVSRRQEKTVNVDFKLRYARVKTMMVDVLIE